MSSWCVWRPLSGRVGLLLRMLRLERMAHEEEGHGWGQRGQASLEYALVLFAFLATLVALAALWRVGSEGGLLERAVRASSHAADGSLAGQKDLWLY